MGSLAVRGGFLRVRFVAWGVDRGFVGDIRVVGSEGEVGLFEGAEGVEALGEGG